MIKNKIKTHYRPCSLCEAMCGLKIKVYDDKILSIKGNRNDIHSRGYICPKGIANKEIHEDPDRLKHPLQKTKTGWEPVSWNKALSEIKKRINKTVKQYGKDSVAIYLGNPIIYNYGASMFAYLLMNTIKTRNIFTTTSVDHLPHLLVSYHLYGSEALIPVPDIDNTDLFIIMGSNPLQSNGSLMSVPGIGRRLREMQQRGGKLVVIDPRRTETAKIADFHYPIRPGTDALFLLATIQVLFEEELINPGKIAGLCEGLESLKKIVHDFRPEKVSDITGIKTDKIRSLARKLANAKSAVCYGRLGMCTQEFGTVNIWLINILNIITGNLDREGGSMFPLSSTNLSKLQQLIYPQSRTRRWTSRVSGLPEMLGEIPTVAMPEEILTEGEGQIKVLITVAGNPALSSPNSGEVVKALSNLDYIVSFDNYINATTRFADIILPNASPLEDPQYRLIFNQLATRNIDGCYGEPIFDPPNDTPPFWKVLKNIVLLVEKNILKRTIIKFLSPDSMLGIMIRFGPYGKKFNVFSSGLSLRKVKKNIDGIDLGPLKSSLPERLLTKDKKINLCPEEITGDIKRLKKKFKDNKGKRNSRKNMLLIGRRQLRGMNSWMHNNPGLLKNNSCTAWINPKDAKALKISNGEIIIVSTGNGKIEVEAEVTPDIMEGSISIPYGWGHNLSNIRLKTARLKPGVGINTITDNKVYDRVCGISVFNGIPVIVEKRKRR